MDTKSKILIIVLFTAISWSVYSLYDKYVHQKNFAVFENKDGLPIIEE